MSLDLSYSAGLAPVFHFVPSGYVLDGTTTAELIIRTRDGVELYISGDGITVVDITLTKAMRFGDGTTLPSGSVVKALRVAPDLSAIDPPLADPADKVPMVYRYGLYVGTATGWDWDVQGLWTVNPDTGPVRGMCGPQAVCVGPVMVAVNVCGVMAGSSAATGGYLELEFSAADLAGGLPLLIGSVPDASLIRAAVVRFFEYFDEPTLLKIGQDAKKKHVYTSAAPYDDEGYKTEIYDKFSGEIYLYPEFQTAPATGAGVIYVTY
jgi:hypothetical protein